MLIRRDTNCIYSRGLFFCLLLFYIPPRFIITHISTKFHALTIELSYLYLLQCCTQRRLVHSHQQCAMMISVRTTQLSRSSRYLQSISPFNIQFLQKILFTLYSCHIYIYVNLFFSDTKLKHKCSFPRFIYFLKIFMIHHQRSTKLPVPTVNAIRWMIVITIRCANKCFVLFQILLFFFPSNSFHVRNKINWWSMLT